MVIQQGGRTRIFWHRCAIATRKGGKTQVARLDGNENHSVPRRWPSKRQPRRWPRPTATPPRSDGDLPEVLAAHLGNGLTAANIFCANGGVNAISLVEDAILGPGDRALVTPPCFGAYTASLTAKNVPIDTAPLVGDAYKVDVDAVLGAVTDQTRLVYLCNPNNPTGTVFGADSLAAILDGLPESMVLIYDEVYHHFATEFDLPDAQKYVRDRRNIVIIHSFSKAYGLAGMRIGYGIAQPDLAAKIAALKDSYHVPRPNIAAAMAALTDTEHLRRTIENNTRERARMAAGIRALGLAVTPSQANFLMFGPVRPECRRKT